MSAEPTKIEWFVSGGRVVGVLAMVLCAVAVVVCLVDGVDLAVVAGILLFALLSYAALLRPRVGTTHDRLVYRRMFSDLSIPLAAISEMRVARYFEVTAGERRFVSPAVGRSLRRTVWRAPRDPFKVYADLVEDQTRARMESARAESGVRIGSAAQDALLAQVRRTWAWPEIGVGLVILVVLVVTLVL